MILIWCSRSQRDSNVDADFRILFVCMLLEHTRDLMFTVRNNMKIGLMSQLQSISQMYLHYLALSGVESDVWIISARKRQLETRTEILLKLQFLYSHLSHTRLYSKWRWKLPTDELHCLLQFEFYFAWHKNSINDLCPNQLESNELYLMS